MPAYHREVAAVHSYRSEHLVVVMRVLGCSVSSETTSGGLEDDGWPTLDAGLLTRFKRWATARWNPL